MSNRALIIGGPGTLSSSSIDYLLARGYQVGVLAQGSKFDRLPAGVTKMFGNRNQKGMLSDSISQFHPDVVIDFVCFEPEQAENAYRESRGNVGQYIFISTVDVYGYPLSRLPFREDDAWHPSTQSPYAENKRKCEEIFWKGHSTADFPLTIARPAYSFGPEFILSFMSRDLGYHMLRRIQQGRPVMVPGDGSTLMHVSSAYNTGEMIAALVGESKAMGKSYTCGHPYAITHEKYIRLFSDALSVTPEMVHIPSETILKIKHPAVAECLLPALTRYNVAFSADRFLRDFPEFKWSYTLDEWTSHVVSRVIELGLLSRGDEDIFDDELIHIWQEHEQKLINQLSNGSES